VKTKISKYTKDARKKKSRIEIFYKANIKSGHKTDKLKKGIFFYCYLKLQLTMHIYANNTTVSTGIKRTEENV